MTTSTQSHEPHAQGAYPEPAKERKAGFAARLDFHVKSRTGRNGCKTRHLGLCGRVDKSGEQVSVPAWEEIHPAFRCAACTWILTGEAGATNDPRMGA